jgi:hypothetical protein
MVRNELDGNPKEGNDVVKEKTIYDIYYFIEHRHVFKPFGEVVDKNDVFVSFVI